MAKGGRPPKQSNGESLMGWFRKVFLENRQWLKGRSNAAVVKRWEEEHPGQVFGPRERNACNNVKSILRKRRRKHGRRDEAAETGPPVAAIKVSRASLELLEERIDDCMVLTRALDREGLKAVHKLLRQARNEVVWKQGQ